MVHFRSKRIHFDRVGKHYFHFLLICFSFIFFLNRFICECKECVKTSEIPFKVVPPQEKMHPIEVEYSDEDDVATKELHHDDYDPKGLDMEDELLSEEEEEEISSEGNDYDSESSVDDSDLLKRLDAKYGKLPTASDEDEPDYDVDDEDIDPTWTST